MSYYYLHGYQINNKINTNKICTIVMLEIVKIE